MIRRTRFIALLSCVVAGMLSFVPALISQEDPTNVGFIGSYKTAAEKTDPSNFSNITRNSGHNVWDRAAMPPRTN